MMARTHQRDCAGSARTCQPRARSALQLTHVDPAVSLQALEHVYVEPGVLKAIVHPDREVTVHIPLPQDNGQVELVPAYLVQHNNVRGPFKGGLIFHQDVTIEGLRK